MPQISFFVGAAASGIGGVGVLLAWDRHDRGPAVADDIDISDVGLYSWLAIATGAQLIKMKTRSPISIPEENCPSFPDGAPDGDFFNRLEFRPGGVGLSQIGDMSLDVFDGSNRVYGVAPEGKTLKFEMAFNSILATPVSVQDRPTLQPWEDPLEGLAQLFNSDLPTKELWRALMTPNQ